MSACPDVHEERRSESRASRKGTVLFMKCEDHPHTPRQHTHVCIMVRVRRGAQNGRS